VLRQNYLFYYKTKNEKKGKFIRLNDCVIESSVDSKKKIIFIIINHDKQYPMYGETDDISAEWIKDLQNTISAIPDLEKNKGKATLSEKRRNSKRYTTLQKLRISFAPKQQKEPDTEEKKDSAHFNAENGQKQKKPEPEENKPQEVNNTKKRSTRRTSDRSVSSHTEGQVKLPSHDSERKLP